MKKTQILLACYNGEKYLHEQIDSLLAQSYTNFEILARDDCSTDGTLNILQTYADRLPFQFKVVPSKERLGVIGNFSKLMEHSTADYLLFSDQDDVWLKDRVRLTLDALWNSEGQFGPSTPLLVHTDLCVINHKKELLHPSFWAYSRLKPLQGNTLNRLLVQNCVTGCTMAINKALLTLATPIPLEVRMHDWWLALIASSMGRIISLPEKTLLYRQHGSNALGAKKTGLISYASKCFEVLKNPGFISENVLKLEQQAQALFDRCASLMPKEERSVLSAYLSSPQLSSLERKRVYLKYRFFRHSSLINFLRFFLSRPF